MHSKPEDTFDPEWINKSGLFYRSDPSGFTLGRDTTEAEVDQIVDALLNIRRVNPIQAVQEVLKSQQIDPDGMDRLWHQEVACGDLKGVLGLASFTNGAWYRVIHTPLLPLIPGESNAHRVNLADLQIAFSDPMQGTLALEEGLILYQACQRIEPLNESQIRSAMASLRNHYHRALNEVINAYLVQMGHDPSELDVLLPPVMPEIDLPPLTAERICRLLYPADRHTRILFNALMEAWAAQGYIVDATPGSIVLDAPYGLDGQRVRLAVLLPGVREQLARQFEGVQKPEDPALILRWASLRRQAGLSPAAFEHYQQAVRSIAGLRLTPSNAHLQGLDQLDENAVRKLSQAMAALVESIDHGRVPSKPKSKPVKQANIEATLDRCGQAERGYLEDLVQAWRYNGGTVHSPRVGRIYLRFKTHGQQPHQFSLATIHVKARGDRPVIKLAWELADLYLEDLPDAVDAFKESTRWLPGFEQHGKVTRVVMGDHFTERNSESLVRALLWLKYADYERALHRVS